MLMKHDDVRRIAHTAVRYIRAVVERDRGLDDTNLKEALRNARDAGLRLPMIQSSKSLAMIAEEYIENVC